MLCCCRKLIQTLTTVRCVLKRTSWTTWFEFCPASESENTQRPQGSQTILDFNDLTSITSQTSITQTLTLCSFRWKTLNLCQVMWHHPSGWEPWWCIFILWCLVIKCDETCLCVSADTSSIKCVSTRGWMNTAPVPCVNSTSSKLLASWWVPSNRNRPEATEVWRLDPRPLTPDPWPVLCSLITWV